MTLLLTLVMLPVCSGSIMPATRNIDIKCLFERYDGIPGPRCRTYRRNLIQHGGRTDARGYSLTDCLLRQDEGALAPGTGVAGIAAVPMPGAPPMPPNPAGGGAAGAAARARYAAAEADRKKRQKEAASYVILHLDNEDTLELLDQPQYQQNGSEIFDYIMQSCLLPLTPAEILEVKDEIRRFSIKHDVGSTENSVLDLLKLMRTRRLLLAPGSITDDELCEYLLRAIIDASSLLFESALEELNGAAGPPGPGVRRYQIQPAPAIVAAVALAGLPLPAPVRDLMGCAQGFHLKWRDGVRAGKIPKQGAVTRAAATPNLEIGRSANLITLSRDLDANGEIVTGRNATMRGPAGPPQRSLEIVRLAGIDLDRDTTTTTDWNHTNPTELGRIIDAMEMGEDLSDAQYDVVMALDAQSTPVVEMLCLKCLGSGHGRNECPSSDRFRSFAYQINLLQMAKERADARGTPGGRRATQRGQAAPLRHAGPRPLAGQRQHPPAFSPTARSRPAPFRRFRPAEARARSAEEEAEDEEEQQVERGGAAVEAEPEAEPPTASPSAEEPPTAGRAAAETKGKEASHPTRASFAGCQSYFNRMDQRGFQETTVEKGRGAVIQTSPDTEPEPDAWAGRRQRLLGASLMLVALGLALLAAAILEMDTSASTALATVSWASATRWPRAAARRAMAAVDAVGAVPPYQLVAIILLVFALGRVTGQGQPAVTAKPLLLLPPGYDQIVDVRHVYRSSELQAGDEVLFCRNAFADAAVRALDADAARNSSRKGESFLACFDSGATGILAPMEDIGLADEITDEDPKVTVEIADGFRLKAGKIGNVNSTKETSTCSVDTFRIGPDGRERPETTIAPKMTRWVFTHGLKSSTRLIGVTPARDRDGILAYFNEDNSAGISDCVRFPGGHYARFNNDGRNEITFNRISNAAERALVASTAGHSPTDPPLLGGRSRVAIHASAGHGSARRIALGKLKMNGTSLTPTNSSVETGECTGCRLGRCPPVPFAHSASKSQGGRHKKENSTRVPSTVGYAFFGQRMDTDMCTTMPKSFPHSFTTFTNFCDRYSAETFLYFQLGPNSAECASSMRDFERRVKHRLTEGKIWLWCTDNDLAYEGPEISEVVDRLVHQHERRPPGKEQSNALPVPERNIGVVRQMLLAMHAYPRHYGFDAAPDCLWSWAAQQCETLLYFLGTEALSPPTSPYRLSHPDAEEAEMDWAYPMFCDATVRLQVTDVKGKVHVRGEDGCHLGYDRRRGCHFVFLPSINRLGSFVVTHWKPNSFLHCRGITFDTPVTYREDGGDLSMSPATVDRVPLRRRARTARDAAAARGSDLVTEEEAENEILRVNAAFIKDEVQRLEDGGAEAFKANAVECMQDEVTSAEEPLIYGQQASLGTMDPNQTVEIELDAPNERAYMVAENAGLLDLKTVDQMMNSQWWELIKESMEQEIQGKLANKFCEIVARPAGVNVIKTKWVLQISLNEDGSIRKLKARLVGCGYSQVPGQDFDKVYASTPPALTMRYYFTVVADEKLMTDKIDAIKAFTQAGLDKVLYAEMADGFVIPGFVYLLLKALEGIKQGAYLWFQKNKWAWNKCGLYAKLTDPNLYTHPILRIIAAVFADDCGIGFKEQVKKEYLAIRLEYSKLINIDSPGPDLVVPITMMTGIDVDIDYDAGTVSLSQRTNVGKLALRYKDRVTMNDMPTPPSKAKREAFENMAKGTEENHVDRVTYLEDLGRLGWTAVTTYPEIAFYHSVLGQHMQWPTQEAHDALLYVMGYVINNQHAKIVYGGKLRIPPGLHVAPPYFYDSYGFYVSHDSSWGKLPRPQAGHSAFRCNATIHWSSSPLKIVTTSTAHAESAEMARALKTVIFGRILQEDSGRPVQGPTAMLGDNSACHELVQKEGSSQLTRHFERAIAAIKYAIIMLNVKSYLVSTEFMTSDIFTKAVDEETFHWCKHELRNTSRESFTTRKISKLRAALSRAVNGRYRE